MNRDFAERIDATCIDSDGNVSVDVRIGSGTRSYVTGTTDRPAAAAAFLRELAHQIEVADRRGPRYWMLITDGLAARNDLVMPDGMRLVERGEPGPSYAGQPPHAHWWLTEDEHAPAELDGQRVEPTFTRHRADDGTVTTEVSERVLVNDMGYRLPNRITQSDEEPSSPPPTVSGPPEGETDITESCGHPGHE